MGGQVFIIVMIAAMALLAVHEFVRYRRASADPDAIPYPRRRLQRRLTIAALFILLLALAFFWPHRAAPGVLFALMFLLLALLGLALVLLLRDLQETSRSVVQYSAEVNRATAAQLQELMAEQLRLDREEAGKSDREKTPEAADSPPRHSPPHD